MKRHLLIAAAAVAASAAALLPSPSAAQTSHDMTNVYTCRNTGADLPPLGDREAPIGQGHWLMVSGLSCHINSGPLAGGVATGSGVWELNGPTSKELAFSFVVRKPGADRRGPRNRRKDGQPDERLGTVRLCPGDR